MVVPVGNSDSSPVVVAKDGTPTGGTVDFGASPGPRSTGGPPAPQLPSYPAGVSFGTDYLGSEVRLAQISASSATATPGKPVDLVATGLGSAGQALSTLWSWSQTGSGTEPPWSETNAYRGYVWNQGGGRAQFVPDWGNARAGKVKVLAKSANGSIGSVDLVVPNVPPALEAFSAQPVVSGSASGSAVVVPSGTSVQFELKYSDGNGLTEIPASSSFRWMYYVRGMSNWQAPENGAIDWNYDQKSGSYGYTSWTQPLIFGAAQSGSLEFSVYDGDVNVLRHRWQVVVP